MTFHQLYKWVMLFQKASQPRGDATVCGKGQGLSSLSGEILMLKGRQPLDDQIGAGGLRLLKSIHDAP